MSRDTCLWEYAYLVDFLLYLFFLGAVARIALAKHYGDEVGKRLAIPTGLILAHQLVTAQDRLGFRIEKLGPAAIALIGLVLVITAYQLLRHAGIPQPIRGKDMKMENWPYLTNPEIVKTVERAWTNRAAHWIRPQSNV